VSHLSILPTVLRDAELLSTSLRDLGHIPHRGGQLVGFAGEPTSVDVWIELPDAEQLGWCRGKDGSLALVGDLQRLSQSRSLPSLLGTITRRYAALEALAQASQGFSSATVELTHALAT
jgi:hypothetical protein